ncbi:MAG: hydrolase [Marinilabiliales bacterium]|nr:MAG: hydrolase [Marinilabiliales bacterium]
MADQAGISRTDALHLLKEYVKNDKMIAHSLASEVVMKAVAGKLNEDLELWGIAGLLHDLDVEITEADPKTHGLKSVEILQEKGVHPEIVDAIKMHNEEATGMDRNTKFQHALACSETITGLVFATALVYPDKKLKSVKPKSIVKRMKEKKFAASVKRENILECEKIGIPMNEFAALSLSAMCEIYTELGF